MTAELRRGWPQYFGLDVDRIMFVIREMMPPPGRGLRLEDFAHAVMIDAWQDDKVLCSVLADRSRFDVLVQLLVESAEDATFAETAEPTLNLATQELKRLDAELAAVVKRWIPVVDPVVQTLIRAHVLTAYPAPIPGPNPKLYRRGPLFNTECAETGTPEPKLLRSA